MEFVFEKGIFPLLPCDLQLSARLVAEETNSYLIKNWGLHRSCILKIGLFLRYIPS
jgi:hypothetical protein